MVSTISKVKTLASFKKPLLIQASYLTHWKPTPPQESLNGGTSITLFGFVT